MFVAENMADPESSSVRTTVPVAKELAVSGSGRGEGGLGAADGQDRDQQYGRCHCGGTKMTCSTSG